MSSSPVSERAAQPTDDDIEAVIKQATSSRPSPPGGPLPGKDTRTQLFVGNLPYRVRWQDLKDLFRKAGTVLRADVSLGPDNRSRGYGTVLLSTAEDAGRAVDMFNGYTWQTRTLEVRLDRMTPEYDQQVNVNVPSPIHSTPFLTQPSLSAASTHMLAVPHLEGALEYILDRPKTATGGGRTLFVGNLPFHCQWQDLKDLFRQAGPILRADVSLGQDGRSRGFGTVTFANDRDADRAVQIFNAYDYNGRTLKVHHDKFAQGASLPVSASTSPIPPQQHTPFVVQHNNVNVYLPHPLGLQYGHTPAAGSSFAVRPPQASPAPHRPIQPAPVRAAAISNATTLDNLVQVGAPSPLTQNLPNMRPSSPRSAGNSGGSSTSGAGSSHHAHPGPISLPPPPPPNAFPVPANFQSPGHSPLYHPSAHMNGPGSYHHPLNSTPHGLPPITPSMPSFNFVPQQVMKSGSAVPSHLHGMHGPPSNMSPQHILGPLSPGMTPGAFWGPAGHGTASTNPYLNPAVGSPVTFDFGQLTPHASAGPVEPADYFPPVVAKSDKAVPYQGHDMEYFSMGTAPSFKPSSLLTNEILRSEQAGGHLGVSDSHEMNARTRSNSESVPSEAGTDPGIRGNESPSSLATSWRSLSDENMDLASKRLADICWTGEGTGRMPLSSQSSSSGRLQQNRDRDSQSKGTYESLYGASASSNYASSISLDDRDSRVGAGVEMALRTQSEDSLPRSRRD